MCIGNTLHQYTNNPHGEDGKERVHERFRRRRREYLIELTD